MTDLIIRSETSGEARTIYVADRSIDFAAWVELGSELDTELIDGIMVERMAAQYPHEWIFVWLLTILRGYTSHRQLGVVLGSRTAVKIDNYNGRLPDILFVRADNVGIIHADAVYGVPDLVVEIVSPGDRPSNLIPLESDYRSLGISEILFIDPQRLRVRVLRKINEAYRETTLTTGSLELVSIPGFQIEVEWLFAAAKPTEFTIIRQLIEAAEIAGPSDPG